MYHAISFHSIRMSDTARNGSKGQHEGAISLNTNPNSSTAIVFTCENRIVPPAHSTYGPVPWTNSVMWQKAKV
jgi:hypothetical protein